MSAADCCVLIVDDNEDNRYTLTRRLAREGYTNTVVATNGREALDLLSTRKFDLMLLDIMMPELNGYEVLERIKADQELQDLPVVMISAIDQIESVARCIELGAEDYLLKPFNPVILRARVSACIEKKRLRDRLRHALHRLERELDAARALQMSMLPTGLPQGPAAQSIDVHAMMVPAREVGGDLYDYFESDGSLFWFLVGDVSGKGAHAAMFMARTRSLVRLAVALWEEAGGVEHSPGQILQSVNRELVQNNTQRMFVTLFLGVVDFRTGALTYTNAGHPSPYVLGRDRFARLSNPVAAPLGVRERIVYLNHELALNPDDSMFVCTDGVAEAMNSAGEFYSEAQLATLLRASAHFDSQRLVEAVMSDVKRFQGDGEQADDVTLLAARWRRPIGELNSLAEVGG